jgi:hypothetical protein
MRIIEIEKLDNGAHRNQSGCFKTIPEGWAVVPDGLETTNFPFGEIEIEETNGVMTVTKWTPTDVPEVEEIEKVHEPSTAEILNTLLGV